MTRTGLVLAFRESKTTRSVGLENNYQQTIHLVSGLKDSTPVMKYPEWDMIFSKFNPFNTRTYPPISYLHDSPILPSFHEAALTLSPTEMMNVTYAHLTRTR